MRTSVVLVFALVLHLGCAARLLKASDLITKHTFAASHRLPKANSQPQVPKPIVISTNLHVGDVADASKSKTGSNRRGRQYLDSDGSTVVVEGVRMPDDESDRVTWRNGRVINNVFVPNDAPRPSARRGKSADPDTARDYTFHAGDTKSGRPVYYVVGDEAENLHADRSPYSYEPADALTSLSSSAGARPPAFQGGVSPQSSSDFVIKEHTYTMCPGCPSFSIPVPVPKASLPSTPSRPGLPNLPFSQEAAPATRPAEAGPRNDTESADNSNFLQRMSHRMLVGMKRLQSQALGLLSPLSGESKEGSDSATSASEHVASDKKDVREDSSSSSSVSSKPSPLAIAGMASVAMLSMSLVSTMATITRVAGRSASSNTADTLQELNCVLESICKGVDQVAEDQRGYFSQVCSQKSRISFDRNCKGENRRKRLLPSTQAY